MDWKQLWEILSAADNVPIIAMIPLLAFYMYLAWKQAHANDVLIEQLAGDAALAKTHHRKAWPFKPGWAKEVHVWPFLRRKPPGISSACRKCWCTSIPGSPAWSCPR